MQDYWWWWGAGVALGLLEMYTATFYLLVLAIGFAAAGFAALAGGELALQLTVAAAVSVVGWAAVRRWGTRARAADHPQADRDLLLDIGERIRVDRWEGARSTRVIYRGASWAVELAAGEPDSPQPGEYVIRRIDANRLVVARAG